MTVRNLINWLEEFDEDATVMIGMYQGYGSDFAYNIDDIEQKSLVGFYGDDEEDVVFLIEGRQVGVLSE